MIGSDRQTPPQLAEQINAWVAAELRHEPPPGDWVFVHPADPALLLTLHLEPGGNWLALVADNAASLSLFSKAGLVLAAVGWGAGIPSEAGWDELSSLVGATARPNGESIAALRHTLEMLSWPLVWSAVVSPGAEWARESIAPWFHATPSADASHPSGLSPATVLARQLAADGWRGASAERMRAASSDSVRRLLAYTSVATRRPIDVDGVVRVRLDLPGCAAIIGLRDSRSRRLRSSLESALAELGRLAPEHAGSRLVDERVELLRTRQLSGG